MLHTILLGSNHQCHLAVNPANYNGNWSNEKWQLVKSWYECYGINHCLMISTDFFLRQNPYLTREASHASKIEISQRPSTGQHTGNKTVQCLPSKNIPITPLPQGLESSTKTQQKEYKIQKWCFPHLAGKKHTWIHSHCDKLHKTWESLN